MVILSMFSAGTQGKSDACLLMAPRKGLPVLPFVDESLDSLV